MPKNMVSEEPKTQLRAFRGPTVFVGVSRMSGFSQYDQQYLCALCKRKEYQGGLLKQGPL